MFEKNFLVQALKNADYVIATVAREIGVSRPTLYDLMKKHGLGVSYKGQLREE
jgi:transcriptional regulator of acetoin/glycerol metabolism